ncbi:MAG: hypothetical protein AABX12_02000 [Nanoarchaeota archaeon]
MEVIVDSNFIVSCFKKNIDFTGQLEEQGFKVLIPREVVQELKDLRRGDKSSHDDRVAIDLALAFFARTKLKHISFGAGKVDDFLIKKGKQGAYIASLDREIKRRVPNRVVIFDAQKRVGPESGGFEKL